MTGTGGAPRIDSYRFGQIVIDGIRYDQDVIILPDRVLSGWWRQEGHRLAVDDLGPVLSEAPEVIVIGQGSLGRMRVPDETMAHLQQSGTQVIVESTGDACQSYNRLSQERRVAAVLHLSC
jgi:hypothetical protein